jgi:BioD-like phosphotransacetylase family protein
MKKGFVADELVQAMIESQSLDKPHAPLMLGVAATLSGSFKDDDWMNVMIVHSLAHKRSSSFTDPAHLACTRALASVALSEASLSHP